MELKTRGDDVDVPWMNHSRYSCSSDEIWRPGFDVGPERRAFV